MKSKAVVAEAAESPTASLLTLPKRVAVVALGYSSPSFLQECMSNQRMADPFDEIWTINRGFAAFPHHKAFVMDDLEWIEAKASKSYGKALRRHDKPIITSTAYPGWPMAVEYPYDEVKGAMQGDDIFNRNTAAYALGLAVWMKARDGNAIQELYLYGTDFVYPDGKKAESGGMAIAYLLGILNCMGVKYFLPQSSTMLYVNKYKQMPDGTLERPPYGYHRKDEKNGS